jgi:hypothetical protein
MRNLIYSISILSAIILLVYTNQLQAQHTTLSSSSITTQIWNGSTWAVPTQIADKDANAGEPDATLVIRGWGWNCGCEEEGAPASATTTCPWQELYNADSHWISDTTWASNRNIGYTGYFRHNFTIPTGHLAKNMKVVIACDDTIDVLMDHPYDPPWTPMGSYYLGSASGNCTLDTIDIGCLGPGRHSMQFILKNTAQHYFGYIYKIEYDLVSYDNTLDIEQEANCCYSASFTYYDTSGSTLTDFTVTPVAPLGGSITINNAFVTDDLLTRGWTTSFNSSSASYSGGTYYSICEDVKTFHFCLDIENTDYYDLIVGYYKGEDLIRADTIHRVPTDSCCGCDDIKIYGNAVEPDPDLADSADCCYNLSFSSKCDLTRIEFVRFTLPPGVNFVTANAPSTTPGWMPESPFNINIPTWHFPSPGYFAAGTYEWFQFCFINNSSLATFPLYINFTDGNFRSICTDTVMIKCEADNNCDSLEIEYDEFTPPTDSVDCCYSFDINAGISYPDIEVVSFTPITPGVSIHTPSATAPAGWTPYSPMTPNSVSWMVPSPPGLSAGIHSSFNLCFINNSGTNPFLLQVAYTDANYGDICLDTLVIKCETNINCDSLEIEYDEFTPQTDSVDCCYSFDINAGISYPGIEVVSFTPITPSVSIHTPSATAPAGWTSYSPMTPNSVSWMVPSPPGLSAGIHSSFNLCFINNSGTNPFLLQVAYTDANYGDICLDTLEIICETDTIHCPEEDTTIYRSCCKESRFTNPSIIQKIDCQIISGGTIASLSSDCPHYGSFTATNGSMWDFVPAPSAGTLNATLCAKPNTPGGSISMIWTVYIPDDTCYYQQSFNCNDTTSGVIEFGTGKNANFFIINGVPNPTDNEITVKYIIDKSQFITIELIDETGNIVNIPKQEMATSGMNSLKINTSFVSSGKYFIIMRTKDGKAASLPIVIVK